MLNVKTYIDELDNKVSHSAITMHGDVNMSL